MTVLDSPSPLNSDTPSESIRHVVGQVPGVAVIYKADQLAGQLIDIRHDDTGIVTVAVIIGTDGAEPAEVVCRRVHSAIRECLDTSPTNAVYVIRVKVGRVH